MGPDARRGTATAVAEALRLSDECRTGCKQGIHAPGASRYAAIARKLRQMRKASTTPSTGIACSSSLVDAGLVALPTGSPSRCASTRASRIATAICCGRRSRSWSSARWSIFAAFGLYEKWWRYVGLRDFESILKAVVVASLVMVGVLFVWSPTDNDLPRSIAVMDLLLTLALIGGVRLAIRSVLERPPRGAMLPKGQEVLIVGAGEGGQLVAKEMQRTPRCARRRSASSTTTRASAGCAFTG